MSDKSPRLSNRPVPRPVLENRLPQRRSKEIDSVVRDRARSYQAKTSEGVAQVMGNQAEYQKELRNLLETFSKVIPIVYSNMLNVVINPLESIAKEELEILKKIIDGNQSVGLIEAGTGSGKTHGVLKFILENPELFRRTLIGSPTRAMSLDVKQTGNERVANTRIAGHHIGGKDQDENGRPILEIKDVRSSDQTIAMTFGKMFNVITHEIKSANSNQLPLAQYDSIIIDEADALDLEMIPLLKWLSKVRPDLKITFMSATLNYRELKNIFSVNDDFVYLAEASERPRPIDIKYATKEDEQANNLTTDKPKADDYISAGLIEIDDWFLGKPILDAEGKKQHDFKGEIIRENNPIDNDESAIVGMPTISAINDFADKARGRYGKKVEVRVLHSKIGDEKFKDNSNRPSKGVPILFVASDVVGRGVKFSRSF